MREREVHYLKAVVIVHGKSELQMCNSIKQKLRLKVSIESECNGNKSIQITSLNKYLSNKIFGSERTFLKKFEDIKMVDNEIDGKFRIFTIMDTDDCDDSQKNMYKDKKMFKDHWAYKYIFPIYNDDNLEDVLKKADIDISVKKGKFKEYIKVFPTGNYSQREAVQLEELIKKLSKVKDTNLEVFLKFCLDQSS